MTVMHLLAGECDRISGLGSLSWDVQGDRAVADLHRLTKTTLYGDTLLIDAGPDALPVVNELHTAGWLRDGAPAGWMWELSATLRRGGCTLHVCGTTITPPEHCNAGVPWYFAPRPPEIPARWTAKRGAKFRAEYREWEQKCRAQAW